MVGDGAMAGFVEGMAGFVEEEALVGSTAVAASMAVAGSTAVLAVMVAGVDIGEPWRQLQARRVLAGRMGHPDAVGSRRD